MSKEQILEKVINITSENMGVPREKINEKSLFIDDFKADSLDQVELIMAFEDEFDLDISDDEAEKVKTVADCVDLISRLLQ